MSEQSGVAASSHSQGGPAVAAPPVFVAARTLVPLVLAAIVVYLYSIESATFLRVFVLATAGFAVHSMLPAATQLPFFVLLSLGCAAAVFSVADVAWLLGSGLVLIGVARLPISIALRSGILAVFAILLAGSRAGLAPAPWSPTVWPILGSMFMFRLVLYLKSSSEEPSEQRGWWALAYFFMLPNLVFPLFPVVDYQTFRRTYFDRHASHIYEQGLLWIVRGLVHLLLYRFIYHHVLIDAASIVTLGDLAQFMLATFLLYLRVSGQFHLIVGMLHLFGFRLPETHKLYYLAQSFTELWRRINIYWTDFMMKTVFYPAYFKVKKFGPTAALTLSTAAVFLTTWILHSYQWFWLRGGFPVTVQDALFWGVLGALVMTGGVRELKAGKKPRQPAGKWDSSRGVRAARTFALFCVLWSLWSTESVSLWLWNIGAAANVDIKGVLIVVMALGIVLVLGGWDWQTPAGSHTGWATFAINPAVRVVAPLLILIALAQPAVQAVTPEPVAIAIRSLQTTGLNARDLALQHRGYYEELDVRTQLDSPVTADGRRRDATWQDLSQLGVLRLRADLMLRDLLPSRATTWNGRAFSTNRWGMRDQDYTLAKPAGTYRIAILGPSHVMGNGVADGETFEGLVEDRLNREFTERRDQRFQILNFGVDGFSLPQQLALLEDRVFSFSPDLVIAAHYDDDREMTEGFVLKVIDGRYPIADARLKNLLAGAGLLDSGHDGVPLPFAWARALAGRAGVRTRMPFGEAQSRTRRVANDVLALSFTRFAEVTRERGVAAAVLALNVVVDDVPSEVPLRDAIDRAGLPVFDLFNVFPTELRPALRVAPWDDHPNAAGHRLIADRLFLELTAFLRSSATAGARPVTTTH